MNRLQENSQRGSALVLAIFVMALLTGLGVALLFLSQSAARMNDSSQQAKKAFYLAEAGIEAGRMMLYAFSPDAEFVDDLQDAAGPNGIVDFDPATVRFVYDSHGKVTGIDGVGDDVPIQSLMKMKSGDDPGWYVAFLTNDPIEGRGTVSIDANKRVMISALGATAGGAVEMAEAILEPFQFIPPVPPAAVTLIGPAPTYDNGNSNAQRHSGDDCGVAGGDFAPIVGTTNSGASSKVKGELNRPNNFTSGPTPYLGEDTVGDLTNGSDPIVNDAGHGVIDPFWLDCEELKDQIIFLAAAADYYCNADVSSCTIPESAGADDIVFIDGDLTNTPNDDFTGTLVVTGTLTYKGNTNWDGIILVVGEGHMVRSGGGNGESTGAVILANIDPSPDGPPASRGDWCSQGTDGFESAVYETSGGGNSEVTWCTGSINAANSIRTYRVVNFVQR